MFTFQRDWSLHISGVICNSIFYYLHSLPISSHQAPRQTLLLQCRLCLKKEKRLPVWKIIVFSVSPDYITFWGNAYFHLHWRFGCAPKGKILHEKKKISNFSKIQIFIFQRLTYHFFNCSVISSFKNRAIFDCFSLIFVCFFIFSLPYWFAFQMQKSLEYTKYYLVSK